jgi:ATP/ADP translocase
MDTLSDVHQSLSKAEPPVKLWQKLLPLALIFFCASFNLTILANLKDAIVVTSAGAEALPFLASFCVLPASLAFFYIYGEARDFVSCTSIRHHRIFPRRTHPHSYSTCREAH